MTSKSLLGNHYSLFVGNTLTFNANISIDEFDKSGPSAPNTNDINSLGGMRN